MPACAAADCGGGDADGRTAVAVAVAAEKRFQPWHCADRSTKAAVRWACQTSAHSQKRCRCPVAKASWAAPLSDADSGFQRADADTQGNRRTAKDQQVTLPQGKGQERAVLPGYQATVCPERKIQTTKARWAANWAQRQWASGDCKVRWTMSKRMSSDAHPHWESSRRPCWQM